MCKWNKSTTCAQLLLLGLSALLGGCSVVFKDAPQACQTTADCTAKRPDLDLVCEQGLCLTDEQPVDPFEQEWGCTRLPSRMLESAGRHTLIIPIVDVNSQKPISGVKVRLCGGLDVGCQFDADDPTTSQLSDAQGLTSFEVADGFSGFFLYEKEGFVPGLYMLEDMNAVKIQRFSQRTLEVGGYGMLKPSDLTLLVSLVSGGNYNPSEAVVNIFFENCQRQRAVGVRSVLDRLGPATTEYYFVSSLPSATVPATDSAGQGGFVNVPPGISTMSVRRLGESNDLGKLTVVTRAGHVTIAEFLPGQRPDVQVE